MLAVTRRSPLVLYLLCAVVLSGLAQAQAIRYPPRPGQRDFIVDEATLIAPADKETIRSTCNKLLSEKGVPIVVVTIASMAQYGAGGWDIRVYAQNLFNTWGIGYKKWNRGILFLVSKQDRKARIELGADWKGTKDDECTRIMEELIVPSFRAGNYSEGILEGVKGLDALARDLKLPKRSRPWWHFALIVGFFALMIFTGVSLYRRGASGWAWVLWAAIFAVVGFLLYQALTSRSRGGGFSGGSFGGGFSGGGGATGSW